MFATIALLSQVRPSHAYIVFFRHGSFCTFATSSGGNPSWNMKLLYQQYHSKPRQYITKKAHNIRALMLTYMCQKCICGQPTTCRETDNITDLFNTDGYIWCPGTICVPRMALMWLPGGRIWRLCGPHMALLWLPGYHSWCLCGRPGAVYGAYVVDCVPHVARIWYVYGAHLARTWRTTGA